MEPALEVFRLSEYSHGLEEQVRDQVETIQTLTVQKEAAEAARIVALGELAHVERQRDEARQEAALRLWERDEAVSKLNGFLRK